MNTIYSVRDSLGRELWWTTRRKSAIEVAEKINAVTVTPGHKARAFWTSNGTTTSVELTHHQLPADVYKCSYVTGLRGVPEKPARPLSERRAADRAVMAERLLVACQEAGATASLLHNGRRIDVRVHAPGGATIVVDFDGRSGQPDVFVQTWNVERTAYNAGVRLRDWEGRATAKRNTVARGFDQLVSMMVSDITAFVSGDGYWK